VDTGYNTIEDVRYAKSLGIDVIVTDHHKTVKEKFDDEILYLNPKLSKTYKFQYLSGAGVAFKLAQGVCMSLGLDMEIIYKYLDIVMIGTIADVVPMIDENRLIIKKGLKKMPAETRNYVINIARFYQQYGGKGDYFSNIKSIGQNGKTTKTESIDNTNRTKIENMQKAENVCPRVKLPEQEISNSANVAIEVGGTVAGTVSGSGKTVFDPAKFAQLTMAIQKAKESLDIMRGQYDALTKGLAGLGLLTNIATVAGYEMPSTMNENVMVKWGNKQDVSLYQQLQEMKAADTGVYASAELDKLTNQNAAAINRAYTESELAWSKANCAANNLDSLMKVKAKTQKQAKDLNNAIRFETAVIEANEAKIKANLLMMNSSYQSYRISASQIYANWKASK